MKSLLSILLAFACFAATAATVKMTITKSYIVDKCQYVEFYLEAPQGNHYLETKSPEFPFGGDIWIPVTKLLHPGGVAYYRVATYNGINNASFRIKLADGPVIK